VGVAGVSRGAAMTQYRYYYRQEYPKCALTQVDYVTTAVWWTFVSRQNEFSSSTARKHESCQRPCESTTVGVDVYVGGRNNHDDPYSARNALAYTLLLE
jgi:hypothetical protein